MTRYQQVFRAQSQLAALLNSLTHELLKTAATLEAAEARNVLPSVPELPQLYEQLLVRSKPLAAEPHYILRELKELKNAISGATTGALLLRPPSVSLRYMATMALHLHNLYCTTGSKRAVSYLENESTLHSLYTTIQALQNITKRHLPGQRPSSARKKA